MGIGERLREERVRLGPSQEAFGEMAGVGKQAQLRYEKGERHPDTLYMAALAKIGVDVLYVLTGQRSNTALTTEERLLLERYRESPQPLRDAALRVLLGAELSSGGATQNFHGPVRGGVAGRDIVNEGRK